jgi:hypothetical protein
VSLYEREPTLFCLLSLLTECRERQSFSRESQSLSGEHQSLSGDNPVRQEPARQQSCAVFSAGSIASGVTYPACARPSFRSARWRAQPSMTVGRYTHPDRARNICHIAVSQLVSESGPRYRPSKLTRPPPFTPPRTAVTLYGREFTQARAKVTGSGR